MAYQQELIEAACYHVDEQTKQIQAFDSKLYFAELPSRALQLFQLVKQHAHSLAKLLRYIYTDESRVRVVFTPGEAQQVHVDMDSSKGKFAIVLLQVMTTDFKQSRLKCILPSEKQDYQNEVQHFDTSADMLAWLKTNVPDV